MCIGFIMYKCRTYCDWVIYNYVHITTILIIVIQQFNFILFISIALRFYFLFFLAIASVYDLPPQICIIYSLEYIYMSMYAHLLKHIANHIMCLSLLN